MSESDPDFEVATSAELAKKYGLTAETRPSIKLDQSKIPKELHILIPYAEFWGISDDIIREDLIEKVSPSERYQLDNLVSRYQEMINEWLAGPISEQTPLPAEYIAFVCMCMAVEVIRVRFTHS